VGDSAQMLPCSAPICDIYSIIYRPDLPLWGRWHGFSRDERGSFVPAAAMPPLRLGSAETEGLGSLEKELAAVRLTED
jgi:hypothetical protein